MYAHKLFKFTLAAMLAVLMANHGFSAEDFRDLQWDDLLPPGNFPGLEIDSNEPALSIPGNSSALGEVVEDLHGQRIRIPGYLISLEGDHKTVTELLLVPYFGACIHVPPPPPNQIIYGENTDGISIKKLDLNKPVWVTGVILTERVQNELAEVGYTMEIEKIAKYNPRARKKR